MRPSDIARFESKVYPEPNSGCWLWDGPVTHNGYGVFRLGKSRRAHRVSYAHYVGDIGSLHVLHRCDVRGCVNPAHLFLGTNEDNVADKISKGRARSAMGPANGRHTKPWRTARGDRNGQHTKPHRRPWGERNGMARLTDIEVRQIRDQYATGKWTVADLARIWATPDATLRPIIAGRTRASA